MKLLFGWGMLFLTFSVCAWAEQTVHGEISNIDAQAGTLSIDPATYHTPHVVNYKVTPQTRFEGGETWDTLRRGDTVSMTVDGELRGQVDIKEIRAMKRDEMSALHQSYLEGEPVTPQDIQDRKR